MRKLLAKYCLSIVLIVGLVIVSGCGQNNNSQDAVTPKEETGSAGVEKIKVALVLPGNINDQGWNAVAYRGLKLIEENLGAQVSYMEKVPQSDMEEAFRSYANQKFDVIFGHGFEYGDVVQKLAGEFKDTMFIVNGGGISQEPNIASLNTDNFQQGFLQGAVAALVTKSNKVGVVGGMDIPPIVDSLRGFEAGVKYINPKIEIMSSKTGSFDDVAKAKETALAIIEKGADVIMGDADQAGIGVIEAAKAKGALAIGSNGDQNSLAPENVVTSATDDLGIAMESLVKDIINGQFQTKIYNSGVKEGTIFLAPYHSFEDKLDAETKTKIEAVFTDIKTGKLDVHTLDK